MIQVKNLKKIYGNSETKCVALDKLSVDIPEGKFVAVTGKSGSGKTTLLNMLGLTDIPDSGSILVDGEDIFKYKRKKILDYRRNKIGIVFQFFQLIPVLNCRDNILMANEYSKKYEKEYLEEILERLDIQGIMKKYPNQLSGGQQQRVAIARAMINRPKILLADEPTGNLDTENSKNVVRLMRDMAETYKMTLIIATHDEDISRQADVHICLQDGRAVEEDADER